MSIKGRIAELRRIVRLHTNWLSVTLLGRDAISTEEYEEIVAYGKLPLNEESISLVERSYILGRLKALLRRTEYKDLLYQDVLNADLAQLTALEELVLEEAKLRAGTHVKGLADDISRGAFLRLAEALQRTVDESTVQGIIQDQTALAIKEKKSYVELAENLAQELKTDWSRDWEKVATTEMQRAKVRGQAAAISNGVGMYANTGGPSSHVSIIPSPGTCEDCAHHYLETDGNPKVFVLKDLLAAGTNADRDHSRGAGGRHAHWQPVLPPMHPECGCSIEFVPPGMGWVSGKLTVTDPAMFSTTISKATDQGSMSGIVKPPGPKSTQGPKPPKVGSVAGAAAPGNTAGPGRPKSTVGSSSTTTMTQHSNIDWESFHQWDGKGAPPPGAVPYKKRDGTQGFAIPNNAQVQASVEVENAKKWSKADPHKPDHVVLDHLKNGEFANVNQISAGGIPNEQARARASDEGIAVGVHEFYQVTIRGNGRGALKPHSKKKPRLDSFMDGAGHTIPGTEHKREVAAYGVGSLLSPGLVPPATIRNFEGRSMSLSQWKETAPSLDYHLSRQSTAAEHSNTVKHLLHLATTHGNDKMREQIHTVAVMDYVMANTDHHADNVLVESDYSKLHSIDNGHSFGNGFIARNGLARSMHSARMKLQIPESLQTRMKNTSLGDLKRAAGGHLEDWEVGQTFLRMHYLMHLQETEGELDFDKLGRTEWRSWDGTIHMPRIGAGSSGEWSDLDSTAFSARNQAGQLPSQLFNSWAKAYIEEGASDESHPYHNDLKQIKDIGVFMEPGSLVNHKEYRASGKHREYEATIEAKKDIPRRLAGSLRELLQGGSSSSSTPPSSPGPAARAPTSFEAASTNPGGRGGATGTVPSVRSGISVAQQARKNRTEEMTVKALPLYLDETLLDGE